MYRRNTTFAVVLMVWIIMFIFCSLLRYCVDTNETNVAVIRYMCAEKATHALSLTHRNVYTWWAMNPPPPNNGSYFFN